MEINLAGFTVMQCMVDMAFHLKLARPTQSVRGQRHALVTIEGPFELRRDRATWQLDAEEHREELGPALGLCCRQVTAATITDEGTLEIAFGDGASLRAPCLPMYEAWNVIEGDGRRLIAMPGGRDRGVFGPRGGVWAVESAVAGALEQFLMCSHITCRPYGFVPAEWYGSCDAVMAVGSMIWRCRTATPPARG